jgi:pimeloyl-ACP methyl ester carboxylesterase
MWWTPPIVALLGTSLALAESPAARPEASVELHTVVATELTWDAAGATVHGTLTLPDGEGPFPGVLLIAGSGPSDRDWQGPLLPGDNGSGRLLAHQLGTEGVAVLRYDKRGTGATALPDTLSWSDYTAEQQAALAVLRDHERVGRVYVAGHSEGGAHALRLAAVEDASLAGVILLATSGRPLRDLVVSQVGDRLGEAGVPAAQQRMWLGQLDAAFDDLAADRPIATEHRPTEPGLANLVAMFEDPRGAAFTRELLTWDPTVAFGGFDMPVLIVSGAKDIQVSPTTDAASLERAARQAGRTVTRVDLPDADHVLKLEPRPRARLDARVGLSYNAEGRTLAPGLVPALVQFIRGGDAPR